MADKPTAKIDAAAEPDALVRQIMKEQAVSREEAEFVAAIERGEHDGDVLADDQ